ncbi:lipase 3-like isoform X2 [Leptopilina heterotoma]|uniref:lipase 3-like isoform X2 n=1 Tax=Leptopilina heterotoma TaxID=63436 RepID=UPI001CA911EA|nr:lipase 3-like isoform X2 [Leptopilina heterotoma]
MIRLDSSDVKEMKQIKYVTWFILFLIGNYCEGSLDFLGRDNNDADLNTAELIKKAGYPAEAHVVITEDGYLLTIHRIPAPEGSTPVFLQHGFLGSSADWVLTGKGKSLAFILADLGYDIWLGNFRGNTYSRSHTSIPSTDSKFWNFSFHEMGVRDLPAMINYVTNYKKDSLMYIGHSMGTTTFYIMSSEKPEMTSKIRIMFSLAPVAFMNHLKSPIRIFAPFANNIKLIAHFFGADEFLPQNGILKFLAKFGCEIDTFEEEICTNSLFAFSGFDASQFNITLLPIILGHTPAGSSTKTLIHYAQEINSGKFQQYDYESRNIEIYNNTKPPEYDLSKIKIPVVFFYADNDWLASKTDVQRLKLKLPKLLGTYEVNYPKFNHLDFLWAIDAPKLVYDKLKSIMEKYKNRPRKNKEYQLARIRTNFPDCR